jgi:Flp pilus assembly protein TadG
MLRYIKGAWHRLRRDERGNAFILFGVVSVPLLLILGGAVDLARYSRHKAALSNAVDAASLALARKGQDFTEEQAEAFVKSYVGAFPINDDEFTVNDAEWDVTKTDEGFNVSASGTMATKFLPLGGMLKAGGGINSMGVGVTSEVKLATNRLELALVLDNTGSMNCVDSVNLSCAMDWASPDPLSRIVALRSAAKTLVDTLMKDDVDDPNQIRIALVPFEGMVNVASTGFSVTTPPDWIAWSDEGVAKYDGRNLNTYNVDADAALERVGHKFLFNKLTADTASVLWAGCVEMRAGSYELSDAAPSTSTPDSLYVPYFAPDEPDDANDSNYIYVNNYLEDRTTGTPATVQKHMTKYSNNSNIRWQPGAPDTDASTSPYENGPNRGCPKPIVPLTNANGKATIKTAIDGMLGFWHSGTYIPAGLTWGWHVLSSGLPYAEGLAPDDDDYDKTVKAIVLLTDGDNEVPDLGNHNASGYSAYSYVTLQVDGANRLGATASAAAAALDTKTAALCTSVKDSGIRLYTITFGPLSSEVQTMMYNCATLDEGERLHYHAPTSDTLEDVFAEIGEDLTNIHLSM